MLAASNPQKQTRLVRSIFFPCFFNHARYSGGRGKGAMVIDGSRLARNAWLFPSKIGVLFPSFLVFPSRIVRLVLGSGFPTEIVVRLVLVRFPNRNRRSLADTTKETAVTSGMASLSFWWRRECPAAWWCRRHGASPTLAEEFLEIPKIKDSLVCSL